MFSWGIVLVDKEYIKRRNKISRDEIKRRQQEKTKAWRKRIRLRYKHNNSDEIDAPDHEVPDPL